MGDLQKRKQLLEGEITVQTDRLLTKQQVILHDKEESANIELVNVQNFIIDSKKELSDTKQSAKTIANQRDILEESRNSLQREVDILSIDNDNLQERLKITKKEISDHIYRKEALSKDISELLGQQIVLKKSIDNLSEEKIGLELSITDSKSLLKSLKSKNETIEIEIDSKIRLKRQQLDEFIQYEQLTRQELTDKQKALEARELIVTVREHKADSQEQIIQTNANLLEL